MVMKAIGDNLIILKDKTEKKTNFGFELVKELDPIKDVQTGTVVSMGKGRMKSNGVFRPVDPLIEIGSRVGFVNRSVMKETKKGTKKYNPNEFIEGEDEYVNVDAGDILYTVI